MSLKPRPGEIIKNPVLCIGLTGGVRKYGRVWPAFQLNASIGRDSVELPADTEFTSSIVQDASPLIGQTVEATLINDTDVVGIGTYTIGGYMKIIPLESSRAVFNISFGDLETLIKTGKININISPYK